MADANHATCPRCGAPISIDDSATPCPRCLPSDTQGGESQNPPVSRSSPEGARRKRNLIVPSTVAAIGAILLGSLWVGNWWVQRQAVAHYNLGVALFRQGKVEEAIAEFRTSIRVKPNAIIHYNLGQILSNQGKPEEAIAEYRAAIRLSPGFAEAHFDLGLALLAQWKQEEANAEFRAAVGSSPTSPSPAPTRRSHGRSH